jgi:hypothetical protein
MDSQGNLSSLFKWHHSFSAIQYTPSANLTLSIARKRFQRSLRNPNTRLSIATLQSEQEGILSCIDQVLLEFRIHFNLNFTKSTKKHLGFAPRREIRPSP